jgi:hypothetical protein
MESGHLAQASLRQGKRLAGSNAALRPPCGSLDAGSPRRRRRRKPDRTPRLGWPHRRPASARVESSCGRRGSPVPEQAFKLARSAALQPSRGSHDAGLPRRRRRCKPGRAMRPCCPAAALTAPQTRHVATMGVVDRLPPVLACGRCAGSATPARGCGCGCFRLRERIRPSGPSMPPLASLPPPRSLLERHACEAVASTVVSRVPCSRLGAGFRAPAPINFFFRERLFRFFFSSTNPSQNQGGNMEHGTESLAANGRPRSPAPPPGRKAEAGLGGELGELGEFASFPPAPPLKAQTSWRPAGRPQPPTPRW